MEGADSNPLWDRICEVYSAARVLSAADREAFLARECAGDEQLQREVLSLFRLDAPPSAFLDGPLPQLAMPFESPSLSPGLILSGRFEVVRFVGAGGMGEVYEAADHELGEPVALKVLRLGQLPEDVMAPRLRREIRLARRITHPNVCRVFDFARHQLPSGQTLNYFVMELLAGETLARRLARQGPLEAQAAVEVARQMSDGLAAAHHAGIVHRDFKPGNVMLMETPTGLRVAVMDFGLAVPVDTSQAVSTLGSTGMLLGTPGYVAPEQLYGGPISAATDVYAFGIVLHELITGRHPRAAEEPSSTPPAFWRPVIERCMQLDPKARFASVKEAFTALQRSGASRWRPSRRAFLAGTGVFLGGVSLLGVVLRFSKERGQLPAGGLVLVSPVANTTGESRFDGLTAALQASLTQSVHINVWNSQRLADVLSAMRLDPGLRPDPEQWRLIAQREHVSALVFSTVSRVGAGYVLSITTERMSPDPHQPAYSADQSFRASGPEGLFEALHDAGRWIRESAGESATDIAGRNRLPQDITTSNWQALELLSRAQEESAAGRPNQAIPLLRRAVDLDKDFAMGFMRLGDILNSQRMSEEGFACWAEAIRLARSQRLSEHERLNIESRYAIETYDIKAAEGALLDWVGKYPNDELAPRLLSACLLDLGRFPEAAEKAREAEVRFGDSIFGCSLIVRSLAATSSSLDGLAEPLNTMDRLSPTSWGPQLRGAVAAMSGHSDEARLMFEKVKPVSRSFSLLAVLAGDLGQLDRAAKLLETGIQQDRQSGAHGYASAKAAQLAFVEGSRGNRPAARLWALDALREVSSPRNIILCASTLARHGFLDDARRLLATLPKGEEPVFQAARWRIEGEILVAEGRYREAVERMERSSKKSKALEAREFLARALDLAGEKDLARQVYETLVGTPWIIWNNPEFAWPGIRYQAQVYLKKTKEA